jgi:hypothetical protein
VLGDGAGEGSWEDGGLPGGAGWLDRVLFGRAYVARKAEAWGSAREEVEVEVEMEEEVEVEEEGPSAAVLAGGEAAAAALKVAERAED